MATDWDQHLGVLRESLIALPRLLEGVSADRLHRSPAPGDWSAHVVVCHLALDEMNTTMILRLILTQECPSLVAIDADNVLCEARFASLYPDTASALAVWRVLREDNLRLCASVSSEEIERVGRATWRSEERISLRCYVASRGRHDVVHIDQIRAAVAW